jgi:hypothetical protein
VTTRRSFLGGLAALAAGLVLDPVTGLWEPRRKLWTGVESNVPRSEITILPADSERSTIGWTTEEVQGLVIVNPRVVGRMTNAELGRSMGEHIARELRKESFARQLFPVRQIPFTQDLFRASSSWQLDDDA